MPLQEKDRNRLLSWVATVCTYVSTNIHTHYVHT